MGTLKKLIQIHASQVSYFLAVVIALLLFYAAMSKLLNYEMSKDEMLNQVFPEKIALQLVWLVPLTELTICGLLLNTHTIMIGFYASALLMASFSIYISIAMTGIFGRIPCSCGGILEYMSYRTHLVFNLFFLGLALLGIAIGNHWI